MAGNDDRNEDQVLWQYVAGLKPQLRDNVQVIAQQYRDERWYLIHDTSAGRFIRLNNSAYDVLGRLNGNLSLHEILLQVNAQRQNCPLNADDVLAVIARLHEAELLVDGLPLSAQDVLDRYKSSFRFRRLPVLSNPLAIKMPLLNPDSLLNAMQPLARFCFSPTGLGLWLLIITWSVLVAVAQSKELLAGIADIGLNTASLIALWCLFPVIKCLHELGHGLAIKRFGGPVCEAGINFLVFFPLPYVDGTASWAFRNKYKRALVGAAGILVELFIAGLALLLWSVVEPGLIKNLALQTVLIASVSTLLFNANPLLKFDGYYVLEDLTEIPNLATRSKQYYLNLIQRHLLAIDNVRISVTDRGERLWLLFYGVSAPVYRLLILFSIALYLTSEYLVAGVVLAGYAVLMQIVRPLYHGFRFLFYSKTMVTRRRRATMFIVAVVLSSGLIFALPVPLITNVQGVVWVDEQAQVVAGASGFIEEVYYQPMQQIASGEPLFRLRNVELEHQARLAESEFRLLRVKQIAEHQSSRAKGQIIGDQLDQAAASRELAQQKLAELQISAGHSGTLVYADPYLRPDQYIEQGQLLAYLLPDTLLRVRAVIPQSQVGLLQDRPTRAEVMTSAQSDYAVQAQVIAAHPAGTRSLPTAVLGEPSGGDIPVDNSYKNGLVARELFFLVDLELTEPLPHSAVMGRVLVRLEHGYEAIGIQGLRALRQLLLRHLNS